VAEKKESKVHKAHIVFSKAEGYKLVPATGGWGGISPQKEIILDFYVDQRRPPSTLDVEEREGKLKEIARDPKPEPIDRILQFGVILRPDIARSIGKFLIEKAQEAFGDADE